LPFKCNLQRYTSEIQSASDQLQALQESADEMTRRYAREALWRGLYKLNAVDP
jgi:hypothetical protein